MAKKKEAEATSHTLMFVGQSAIPYGDTFVYDSESVTHGGTFTVDQDTYDQLAANEAVRDVLKEVDTDYSSQSRAELEEAAGNAGVPTPEDAEMYPTEGSLAVAIEDANAAAAVAEVEVHTAEDQAQQAAAEPTGDEPAQPQEEGAE
jgi:hypothetical protein